MKFIILGSFDCWFKWQNSIREERDTPKSFCVGVLISTQTRHCIKISCMNSWEQKWKTIIAVAKACSWRGRFYVVGTPIFLMYSVYRWTWYIFVFSFLRCLKQALLIFAHVQKNAPQSITSKFDGKAIFTIHFNKPLLSIHLIPPTVLFFHFFHLVQTHPNLCTK